MAAPLEKALPKRHTLLSRRRMLILGYPFAKANAATAMARPLQKAPARIAEPLQKRPIAGPPENAPTLFAVQIEEDAPAAITASRKTRRFRSPEVAPRQFLLVPKNNIIPVVEKARRQWPGMSSK